jgi:hypothetical protein
MEFVGILTVYAFVALPNGRGKRITIHKENYCEKLEDANDVLETIKELNPHLKLHAEWVITRYIG